MSNQHAPDEAAINALREAARLGFITLINDGPAVVETNYFDSDLAQQGFVFLSWNASVGRLLLPDSLCAPLKDMASASVVIISRGEFNGRDALEIMFEDSSEAPFCLHIDMEQTDRAIPEDYQGGGFDVAVWTRAGLKLTRPGKYRIVDTLPCLAAWEQH